MPEHTKFGLQTDMPWRQWTKFKVASIETSKGENWGDATTKEEWTDNHYDNGIVKRLWDNVVSNMRAIYPVVYPDANDFKLVSGMDAPVTGGLYFDLGETEWDLPPTNDWVEPRWNIMREPRNGIPGPKPYWRPDAITGQHYDGINEWPNGWPILTGAWFYTTQRVDTKVINVYRTDLPNEYEAWNKSWYSGSYQDFYYWREEFFDHGLCVVRCYTDEGLQHGDVFELSMTPKRLKIYYYNPVVNSIEDEAGNPCYYTKESNGTILIFKGLGFNIPDSSLNVYSQTPKGWEDIVRFITFKGLQGQGNYELTKIGSSPPTPGRFYVSSNMELILRLPDNMPTGTYEIWLEKSGLGVAPVCEGYAGDWRLETVGESEGQVYEGERFTFLVSAIYAEIEEKKRGEGSILLFLEMDMKNKLGEVFTERYSYIDVRSPVRFYEGRLISTSSMRRALDDETGLYSVSDMEFSFANNDKEFSKIAAKYILKNQRLQMWYGWAGEPESWKVPLLKMVIDDYDIEGIVFRVKAKDVTQKYWQQKIPFYRCEESEYPDIEDKAKGKNIPDILGLNVLSDETPGAVEAVCIDTINYKYIAARHPLAAITNVYSDGELIDPSEYIISYADGGRTYITFDNDQGNNKITFDCQGYTRSGWNSTNGYIQSPPYLIAYLLTYIKPIPKALIDWDSIENMAAYFENMGFDEAGRLILQAEQDVTSVLQQLLFTYGLKLYVANDGRITLGRKDTSNYRTSLTIFEQVDLLGPDIRAYNVNEAINYAKVKFNYYPSSSTFTGAFTDYSDGSLEDFEAEIEPASPWEFQWTANEELITNRVKEELLKLAYGNRKVEFTVPIGWIEELDIFTNFQLQDPYGPTPSGLGERLHYFYVGSLDYDFDGGKIRVVGIDIQWLMRQCMIIGRYVDMTRDWASASEWQRAFAYIGNCNTGRFLDGEPNKKLCKCQGGD